MICCWLGAAVAGSGIESIEERETEPRRGGAGHESCFVAKERVRKKRGVCGQCYNVEW